MANKQSTKKQVNTKTVQKAAVAKTPSKTKTVAKKATSAVSKPVAKPAAKSTTAKSTSPSFMTQVQTFFSNVKFSGADNNTSAKNGKRMKIDRRVILPLLGLLIFALIAYAASRFLVIAWVDKKPL